MSGQDAPFVVLVKKTLSFLDPSYQSMTPLRLVPSNCQESLCDHRNSWHRRLYIYDSHPPHEGENRQQVGREAHRLGATLAARSFSLSLTELTGAVRLHNGAQLSRFVFAKSLPPARRVFLIPDFATRSSFLLPVYPGFPTTAGGAHPARIALRSDLNKLQKGAEMKTSFRWYFLMLVSVTLGAGTLLYAQGGRPGGGPGGGPPGGGGGGGGEKVDHAALFAPPVPGGTSGGSVIDQANGYCATGTLGARLVGPSGTYYVLSNSHVLAGDVVSGGNDEIATVGDPIIQPGLADIGCLNGFTEGGSANTVATLTTTSSIFPTTLYNVDAAVAQVGVDGSGNPLVSAEILEIGVLSSTVIDVTPATVGLPVKKSGRTTGLSKSTVGAINATVTVSYAKEVAGESFTKEFTNQIIFDNKGSKFLNSGDSGSIAVEDVNDGEEKALGLLYAGSKSIAVANPIRDVLDYFAAEHGLNLSFGPGGAAVTSTTSGGQTTGVARALQVQSVNADFLSGLPGVVGHGVGSQNGIGVIKVYVEGITPSTRQAIPTQLSGVPVVVEAVGEIVAF